MKLSFFIAFLVFSVCESRFSDGDVIFGDGEDFYPRYKDVDLILLSPHDNFRRVARRMGFIVEYEIPNGIRPMGIVDTIHIARMHPNVVNLQISVTDLHSDYNTYQTFLHSNLLCATDCYNPNSTAKTTRLVSEKILNYNRLVQVLESKNFELEDYIQICLPYNTPNFRTFTTLLTQYHDWPLKIAQDCAANMVYQDSMLAMITNEPNDAESLLPTIFYQTPYILPEVKDHFPNSLSLSATWQPLKYAFKELLIHMGWYRVAVLSDDSAYSLDFLEELVQLFIKEGITFIDQKCSGKYCDFTPALKVLQEEDARIIILNVDKQNAGKLVNAVKNLDMVTWIMRDMPFNELGHVLSDVFSITLSPVFHESDQYYPYLSSITEGIRIIDRSYKNAFGDKEKFQREFAKEATRPIYFKTNAYITRRTDSDIEPALVAIMNIEGDAVNMYHSTSSYHKRGQPDSSQQCVVRSRAFSKPCAHEELLLLVGVCVMFALSMLVVVVCFNMFRKSRFYQRLP